ncbi:DUF4169 family protein [Yangia mangrovi]|uniref:DUF4169 domain-containing protein n=1 Tax=Alloyangia mangrovi TaxID=1779329 RepID=A0A2A3JQS6_9RHOB|nr:DUF4169 family protein [Alloyangia mangrovi]MCA0940991.1 DUF4169 family protein [Alloyangia pacifica]MCA0944331.1 DUF4169 family protein [Alloyangia pacifica]MCT4369573.1 DUF4169 family protein [Alloyangia mangrovi]
MSNVINLNRVRKDRARAEKRAQADENAARHGRSKADKQREAAEAAKSARALESHKLDAPDEQKPET